VISSCFSRASTNWQGYFAKKQSIASRDVQGRIGLLLKLQDISTALLLAPILKTLTLKYIREDMETLLNKYFRRIENFQRLLGSGRVRVSIRRAIAKIRWSQQTNKLEELRQDLEIQISMATLAILTSAR
jgi:hypothetical protein